MTVKRKRLKKRLVLVKLKPERKTIPKGPFRDNTHFHLATVFDAAFICDCLSSSMGMRIYPESTLMTSKAMDEVLKLLKGNIEEYLNDSLRFNNVFWKEASKKVTVPVSKMKCRTILPFNSIEPPPTILNGRKKKPDATAEDFGYNPNAFSRQ